MLGVDSVEISDLLANVEKYYEAYLMQESFIAELKEIFSSLTTEDELEIDQKAPPRYTWYEKPIHLAALEIFKAGRYEVTLDELRSKESTPHSLIFYLAKNVTFDHLTESKASLDAFKLTYPATEALLYNSQAIGYHMMSMNDLVAEGTHKAFLKAVQIDPSVASCKTFSRLILTAHSSGDSKFLDDYSAALKGPHQALRQRKHARFFYFALSTAYAAAGKKLSRTDAANILIDTLGMYADNEDPEQALKRGITDWQTKVKEVKS
ncbi:MAG: hypothetical protein OXT49_06220 [Gammaproteobacteria bacterium]|nr:hypothetical protein [Gammaproteobacteria bacterium]